jgi:hypothetical protein
MPRSGLIRVAALAGVAVLALALTARAGSIPADALPLPNRVAAADVVVVGKVTAIEDKTVTAAPFPGATNKVEYKVAVVTVGDALMGAKGEKTVRLGFVPTPPMVVISPAPFQPTVGTEGVFFLTKHADAGFYLAPGPLDFLDKKSPTFEKDVALLKRCARIMDDPNAALKGTNAEDRFLAAAMLVARYRTRKLPNDKTEPIDAEQSKRILEALAAADWTPTMDLMQVTPLMVLHRLPLTKEDGWEPPAPQDQRAYAAYAQKWTKEHAGSYRIQRFVADKGK